MDSSVDAVIIGMGYVGLPLAREASAAGLSVIGLDVHPEVVDGLNHGRSHVDDLADADVGEMLGRGFFATADTTQTREYPTTGQAAAASGVRLGAWERAVFRRLGR